MGAHPSVLADRFELSKPIGEGSLNTVYAALDRETNRRVAVKLPRTSTSTPDSERRTIRRRFEREAAALSIITSAHVVELVWAGTTDDGDPFLVLERLEGRDLEGIIDAWGAQDPALVGRVISDAAAALELAHGLGIVHRDLKPANLFIHAPDGHKPTVKVLDFGMVFDVETSDDRARDAFGGTPLYMAPEQVRAQLTRIGPATDIWAIGMVTTRLLTGEPFWTGTTPSAVMREVEGTVPEPPSRRWPWLGAQFDAWFGRSTERVPERRFRSVAGQAAQLAQVLLTITPPNRSAVIASIGAASTLATRTSPPALITRDARGATVVGRHADCASIAKELRPGTWITLTGAAGIGKTRLAQLVCERAGEDFLDGGWHVSVGAGAGPEDVLNAIAAGLAIEPDSAVPLQQHVVAKLRDRRVLLVLDGLEPSDACRQLCDRLVAELPETSWLATSRVPLDVTGERCIGVQPLELPRPGPITDDEAATFSAVELFVRRSRAHLPGFQLDASNTAHVVDICRAVAGYPLAIELAAAQMSTSSPEAICAALTQPTENAARPGEAVRSAVAWSYGLLQEEDRALLRHLAVLPAGLTFSQVQERLGHLAQVPAAAVQRLVRSNLVSWSSDSPRRLVMIDAVRELCHELSSASNETAALWQVARAHAEAVTRRDDLSSAGHEDWLTLLDAEHDNLTAVLRKLLPQEADEAMALAGRLSWYWYLRGRYAEGARWLEESLAHSLAGEGPELTRALHGAGRLALLRCRYDRANRLLQRARELANASGDRRGEAEAVQLLGSVARERGWYSEASALHERGLGLWQQLGDQREAGRARNYLCFAAWLGSRTGDPGSQQREWWSGRAERELRKLGDPEGIVWALLNHGAILHYAGDEAARSTLGRAFSESIAHRFEEGIAWSLNLIGLVSLARNEWVQARAQLGAALRVHRRLGDLWRCASVVEALAAVEIDGPTPERTALYFGAADSIRERIGAPVPVCERALFRAVRRRGVDGLGKRFHVAMERGRGMSLDGLVALATSSG